MVKHDYAENRDSIRIAMDVPAEVYEEQQGIIQGTCINLSVRGMFLSVKNAIPINNTLTVVLTSKNSTSVTLKARCVVKRLLKTGDDEYVLGLQILDTADVTTGDWLHGYG